LAGEWSTVTAGFDRRSEAWAVTALQRALLYLAVGT